MCDFFVGVFLLCLIALIVGLIKPAAVIRWGDEAKKNRKNVLKYYGTAALIFFILVGITAGPSQQNSKAASNKPAATDEKKLSDNKSKKTESDKKAASEIDNKITALGDANALTLNKESSVKEIRDNYNLLTEDQKKLVTKLDTLTSAEKKISDLKAAEEKVAYDTGITYDQLARTPDNYKGKKVKFSGQVIQVMEDNGETDLRISTDENNDKVLLAAYDSNITKTRVLENDKITIKGVSQGLYTYESTLGGKITVPLIKVDAITINN